LARKGGTKKPLPALLSLLIRTAEREDIDMKKGPWPTNEDALGKQLSSLKPVMAAKGVQLVRHNERPRAWSISPLIEGSDEGDVEVADTKTREDAGSANADTSRPPAVPEEGRSEEPGLTDEQIGSMLDGVLS
jgi:hypothetical protein